MHTKIFTQISTPRLIIRPVILEDAENYFASEQASINELLPHWSWAKTDKSVDDIKKFISEAIECHEKEYPAEMNFAVIAKESDQFLGMIWFYGINWHIPSFELLYWLDTRETGKGYMTEAVNALTRAFFDLYEAKRVQISVSSNNDKSKKIVEKLNFKFEAHLQNYFIDFATNKIHDGLLFSCCDKDVLPILNINIISDKQNKDIIRGILKKNFL